MSITIEGTTPGIRLTGSGSQISLTVTTGAGGGGSFDGEHNDLPGRDAADAHPISAITGLEEALANAGGGPFQTVGLDIISDGFPVELMGAARTLIVSTTSEDAQITLPPAESGDVGQRWHVYAPLEGVVVAGVIDSVFPIPGGHVTVFVGVPIGEGVVGWGAVETVPMQPGGGGAVGRVNYQGAFDCSTNPNYPSAAKGDSYRVSVAGRIGGGSGVTVAVGDSFECLSDSTSGDQAAVGVNWRVFRGPSHTHPLADLTGGSNDDFVQRKAGAWTNRSLAQVKADLGSIGFIAPRVVGEYYTMPGPLATAHLGGSISSGRLTCIPVLLHAGAIDRLGVITSAAGSGTSWRVGIYPAGANGLPDGEARVVDAGSIDMGATAGVLVSTVSVSVGVTGVYWLAALGVADSSAPTVFGWNAQAAVVPYMLGHPTKTAFGADRGLWCRTATGVSTSAIPATCPSLVWHDSAPKIIARAA